MKFENGLETQALPRHVGALKHDLKFQTWSTATPRTRTWNWFQDCRKNVVKSISG